METLKQAFVVFTNSDLTEGRGFEFPIAVCEAEATAIRLSKKAYVMGSDAPIRQFTIRRDGGYWFGPVKVIAPTKEDESAQVKRDARRIAIEKARAAGLTDDEISAIAKDTP